MNRFSTVPTIMSFLNVDKETAKKVRGLVKEDIDPEEFESVQKWIRECYNRPSQDELIMEALNEVLDGCGPEAIEGSEYVDSYHRYFVASYVNMGDTYAGTVILDHRSGRYLLGTWGGFVEHNNI